jgi:protoporphyrinogen oxidase
VRDESAWVALTMMMDEADDLEQTVRQELKALFKIDGSDPRIQIFGTAWKKAIPRYGPELLDAWESARSGWCAVPGRILFGNYTGQVSIRGMIHEAGALRQSAKGL